MDDDDDDDDDADVPDLVSDMELSKTPGGQDTQVTATDSLTPPTVQGLSPPVDGESLFPDAPVAVQKLPAPTV